MGDSNMSDIVIREAKRADIPQILDFIKALAEYERLPNEVKANSQTLEKTIFDERYAEVFIAEYQSKPAGFSLFFHNYSTWLARPGIYLEDLFVYPELRGKGIGKALLKNLAKIAIERDCGRLEWSVLDWNTPALEFYKSLGAKMMDEWTVNRVTGNDLIKLAE
jgi:GNAT superfamily N-acetyltransferase